MTESGRIINYLKFLICWNNYFVIINFYGENISFDARLVTQINKTISVNQVGLPWRKSKTIPALLVIL